MQKRVILVILIILFSSGVYGILGDFDKDGCVKFNDFVQFAQHFDEKINDTSRVYDLDNSGGRIDFQDFVLFANNFGKCESINVAGKEVPLGSNYVDGLEDRDGILVTLPGLKVHTSLTSAEDDYQTDVVLEADRDTILYRLHTALTELVGKTFNFMGHNIRLINLNNNVISIELDGEIQTVRNGDAFIGESVDAPRWVWNIEDGSRLGVENNFIFNDDSDNPPKVGECISLPNNYGGVCLNGLTVGDDEYDTLTIEYENSADLSDADPVLSAAKTIHIHTSKVNAISLANGISKTEDVWILGGGRIFYKNLDNNKVTNLLHPPGEIGTLNNGELRLTTSLQGNVRSVNINTGVFETLTANFGMVNGEINSLGNILSSEEAGELIWKMSGRDLLYLGTKDEDHRSAYGIIVRDPKAHGSSDEVVLDIPRRQVKAMVEMRGGN